VASSRFIYNLPISARLASLFSSAFIILKYHMSRSRLRFSSANVTIGCIGRSFYIYLHFNCFQACRSHFTESANWQIHTLLKIHQLSCRFSIVNQQVRLAGMPHNRLGRRVLRARVMSYFCVNNLFLKHSFLLMH
jgi:hypothetical protein